MTALDGPTLVLDASGPGLFCGWAEGGGWRAALTSEAPPLESLASAVERCLRTADRALSDVRLLAGCEGPGSILGLRLTAMMANAWSALPAFAGLRLLAYRSLPAAAAALAPTGQLPSPCWLLSPSRQGTWNRLQWPEGTLDVIPDDALRAADVPLRQLPARKGWQQPETDCPVLVPDFAASPAWLTGDLCRPVAQLEVLTPGAPEYREWTPTRHRAPGGTGPDA